MYGYRLVVQTEAGGTAVALRLLDGKDVEQGAHRVEITERDLVHWDGLFDTRSHVERYQGALEGDDAHVRTAEDLLEQLGVFLGQRVLGPSIIEALGRGRQHRTLLVHLPPTEHDALAAAFARIPWEIARPSHGEDSLMERNVVVRAVTDTTHAGDSAALGSIANGGAVRVLLVFAEAPGSRPLAMRMERERLRELFEQDVMPRYDVEVDVLCHGVTLEVLRERITAAGGYHIVHWSGHGLHNRLQLLGEDGQPTSVTGDDLVRLIAQAGGFIPRLFFLSACSSGAFEDAPSWRALKAELAGESPPHAGAEQACRSMADVLDLDSAPGYTGTALALLRSGVPQVVAMRHSVADDYARELAWWFYKRLLADTGRPSTESALALARADVLRSGSMAARLQPIDRVNPVVFGRAGRLVEPVEQRSEQMKTLWPKPQPLLTGGSSELERREVFVGRGRDLERINRAWQPGGPGVTVVQGMAGLGKTSLASEAIHLWHRRFDWVLAFQAKPHSLTVEEFLQQIDHRLMVASKAYRNKREESPFSAVYLEPGRLPPKTRQQQMRTSLIEALRDERVLIVLDNFERNLERVSGPDGYASADPNWDAILTTLSDRLPGTGSRVLVTCRHRLRALEGSRVQRLLLGPLSADEAALFVRSHEGLARLLYDRDDPQARGLLHGVLRVSRGHPLILESLGALVGDRDGLQAALDRLSAEGLRSLPDLAVALTTEQAQAEREYLADAVEGSVKLLLERLSPSARRLLWIISLANEPVNEFMLEGVWAGRSVEDQTRETIAKIFEKHAVTKELFDSETRGWLDALLATKPEDMTEDEPLAPLLVELQESGLVTLGKLVASGHNGPHTTSVYGCHQLVRERVAAWMNAHADERRGRTPARIWRNYGQRYAVAFDGWIEKGRPGAIEVGRRALSYVTRSGDSRMLTGLANQLIKNTNDRALLGRVIAELRATTERMDDRSRWKALSCLAEALRKSDEPHDALSVFEEAARGAEEAGDWLSVSAICRNWARALVDMGDAEAGRLMRQRSAKAARRVDHSRLAIVSSELKALSQSVFEGRVANRWPAIEARLRQLREWWADHGDRNRSAEAPNRRTLARALVGALNTAAKYKEIHRNWQECLDLLQEAEDIEKSLGDDPYRLTMMRRNRFHSLVALGRLDDAKHIAEHLLGWSRRMNDPSDEAHALSMLALFWHKRNNPRQAAELERKALAIRNRLPDPQHRYYSHANLATYLERLEDSSWRTSIDWLTSCTHGRWAPTIKREKRCVLGSAASGLELKPRDSPVLSLVSPPS